MLGKKRLPLFDRHSRSMPFRMIAFLANSTNVSEILKFTSGETSKKPIAFLSAYVSASAWSTCLLKAKCNRLPTRTLGMPGACWKKENKNRFTQVWASLGKSGQVWTSLGKFGQVWGCQGRTENKKISNIALKKNVKNWIGLSCQRQVTLEFIQSTWVDRISLETNGQQD